MRPASHTFTSSVKFFFWIRYVVCSIVVLQPESGRVPRKIRVEPFCSQTLMLSPLCSQQRSKLTSASPVDLPSEDGFSISDFPFCSVFRIYKSRSSLRGFPSVTVILWLLYGFRVGSDRTSEVMAEYGIAMSISFLVIALTAMSAMSEKMADVFLSELSGGGQRGGLGSHLIPPSPLSQWASERICEKRNH